MKLTPEQVEEFHRNGCLVVDGYLDDHEIDHIRGCYVETVERLARDNVLENVQSGEDGDDEFQVYQIRTAHLRHPIFRMVINDSRLLDMVECLLGRISAHPTRDLIAANPAARSLDQDNYYFNRREPHRQRVARPRRANGGERLHVYLPGGIASGSSMSSSDTPRRGASTSGADLDEWARCGRGGKAVCLHTGLIASFAQEPHRSAPARAGHALHGREGAGPRHAEDPARGRDAAASRLGCAGTEVLRLTSRCHVLRSPNHDIQETAATNPRVRWLSGCRALGYAALRARRARALHRSADRTARVRGPF